MKSLLNGLVCMSLLAFAGGCGKDNKSGGSNTNRYFGNLSQMGLNSTSQKALNNLTAWYNNRIEGTKLTGAVTKQKYKQSMTPVQQNCEEKEFLGIDFYLCSHSTSGTGSGVPVGSSQILNLSTGNNLLVNQKSNPELQSIFNNSIGSIVSASQNGNVFRIDFLRKSDNKLVSYIIDKGYHSQLNPVVKIEQSQTEYDVTTVYAQPYQMNPYGF